LAWVAHFAASISEKLSAANNASAVVDVASGKFGLESRDQRKASVFILPFPGSGFSVSDSGRAGE
jgi:hypothetical protein